MQKRAFSLVGFILCTAAVVAGMLIAHFQNLTPCSLCYLERILLIGLAGLFFCTVLFRWPTLNKYLNNCLLLCSATGGALSAYHVYLQMYAEETSGCGASLQYLLQNYPFTEAFLRFIASPQNCGVVDWQFLGLSMASYALILFVTAFTLALLTLKTKQ